VRDLQTGVTRRLSVGQSGSGGGSVFTPALSADGSTVAFTSAADDFVTGDFNGQLDVFTVGVPALAVVDSDHDGLPDDWETYYFGGLGPDGTADADGDGQSNLAEYIAGTNPGDAVSVLRLTAEWSASAQAVTLSWPAAALRKYTVRYRDSLADAVWQELPSAPVAADAGRLKVQDAAPGQQRYYQVLVTK
jgi:hypothetical protein